MLKHEGGELRKKKKKKERKTPATTITTTKSSVSLAKVLDLFLWHPVLVLVLSILGFVVGKVLPLLLDSLGGR
jgi:hypothetical protein